MLLAATSKQCVCQFRHLGDSRGIIRKRDVIFKQDDGVAMAGRPPMAPRSLFKAAGTRLLYFTSSGMLSLWLLNSGAYMHWIVAIPV